MYRHQPAPLCYPLNILLPRIAYLGRDTLESFDRTSRRGCTAPPRIGTLANRLALSLLWSLPKSRIDLHRWHPLPPASGTAPKNQNSGSMANSPSIACTSCFPLDTHGAPGSIISYQSHEVHREQAVFVALSSRPRHSQIAYRHAPEMERVPSN